MRIALHHQALRFGTDFVATELTPCDEELLLGSEAVNVRGARLALQRFLICEVGHLGSPQVSDALAEYELAVVVNVFLDVIVVELIGDAGCAPLKVFQVSLGPPVSQAPQIIELRTLVVEAM